MGQPKWPTTTNTMKPWTRWWWLGSAVDKPDLLGSLQEFRKVGLGGVEITPIYGIQGQEKKFVRYLSPEWMQLFLYTLQQSKKLGLGVDLANGTGWPFGGPWVSDKDASYTFFHKVYSLQKGDKLKEKVQYSREGFVRTANNKAVNPKNLINPVSANKDLQQLALDQVQYDSDLRLITLMAYSAGKDPVDLTSKVDKEKKLNWTAPSGKWTLIALFEGLHGKMVERAAPGGEGYAIDHFSGTATRKYLGRFDSAFKGKDISYLRSFFNDSYEVDDARGQANWSPNFLNEFKKRKGYDLRTQLPALFGLESIGKQAQLLYDYRSVIDELLLEYFTMYWKKWAQSKAALVRNQSHGSPANTLDLYSAVDIPETEGTDILRFKFASSAGNVSGKPLVSAEAATWLDEHFLSSWADVKKIVDLFFLGGVNHIFYHGTSYSPRDAAWPGWLFYAAVHFQPVNPQWKEFHVLNNYITRVQSFLQTAKPDNDVLLYYPIADRYAEKTNELLQHFDGMEKNFENTLFKEASDWMLENEYSFDFFSERQLRQFSFSANKIITGGNQYRTILLPGNKLVNADAFAKLIELAKQGATILVYKQMPSQVPGYASVTSRQSQLDKLLSPLVFKNEGTVKKAAVGKGMLLVAEDLGSLLRASEARKESLVEKGLSFLRKKNASGAVYFLTNRTGNKVNDWIELSADAASIAIFDPATGISGIGRQRKNEQGKMEFFISLLPSESLVIQTYNTEKKDKAFSFFEPSSRPVEVKGPWTIQFLEGGPELPAVAGPVAPGSWTRLEGEAVKNFSGTAKYITTFQKPVDTATYWVLDLGKVHETAEVILNGKRIAGLIGPVFSVILHSGQLKETNTLEIIVANLMANRIAYMDRNNIPWKIFYNINMSARKRENLKNGVFSAADWKPLPSGLLGPVTLTPVKKE
jgi:hypothetical protein